MIQRIYFLSVSEDFHLTLEIRISHLQTDHESVQLSLRPQLCSRRTNRVLSCNHYKRFWQLMCHTIHGHLSFFHNLQQRRLGLTGRTVDLICQQEVGHNYTRFVIKPAGCLVIHGKSNDIRRHNIRCKLHTLILYPHDHRARQCQCGLTGSRHIIQKDMPL